MRLKLLVLFTAALFAAAPAAASGLADLLPLAREHDADFRGARASLEAALTGRVLGFAQLLPSISGSFEVGNSELQRDFNTGALPLKYNAFAKTVSLSISQPIVDLEKWNSYREEDARAAYAALRFADASIEIMVRLSRTYFDALLAEDSLVLGVAQRNALVAQRVEAENLYKGGMATVTDVEETRARELQAEASLNEARYALQLRKLELSRIVGKLPADGLHPIGKIATVLPDPDRLDTWLDAAMEANTKVLSAQKALESSGFGAERARAGHYPSLSLIASATRTKDPNYYTTLEDSSGIALRLNIPIYSGGRASALIDRAAAVRGQAEAELEGTRREARQRVTEAFLGVGNSVAKIRALEQALHSSEISLKGLHIGRRTGLRTNTDVLNGQQQLFSVRRDLQKERYNYLLARIQLKASAGRLTDQDIQAVDRIAKESKPDPVPDLPPAPPNARLSSQVTLPPREAGSR
jgi:TolC family type I secretion outer membrane protein